MADDKDTNKSYSVHCVRCGKSHLKYIFSVFFLIFTNLKSNDSNRSNALKTLHFANIPITYYYKTSFRNLELFLVLQWWQCSSISITGQSTGDIMICLVWCTFPVSRQKLTK